MTMPDNTTIREIESTKVFIGENRIDYSMGLYKTDCGEMVELHLYRVQFKTTRLAIAQYLNYDVVEEHTIYVLADCDASAISQATCLLGDKTPIAITVERLSFLIRGWGKVEF